MRDSNAFISPEACMQGEYIIATYYIELPCEADALSKAASMASGQSVGTWIDVPGITDEVRQKHLAKVVRVLDAPPYELTSQIHSDTRAYLFEFAFPTVNFGKQFPMMITTLLGNDASTSAQTKLVDVRFPPGFVGGFDGPAYGIKGVRKLCGVYDRPLVLNMIKPCTGLTPEQGARIFYDTALGGVDFIKDDELLGNTSFSEAAARVRAYNEASRSAYEVTGKETIYICNITDDASTIEDTLKAVIDAGAKAVMMCFSALGYSLFQKISKMAEVPVLGHFAASGAVSEGVTSGMSSSLSVGKFPRLAGADMVMINTPYGGYPLTRSRYLATADALTGQLYNIKPTMPITGGGVHPGMTGRLVDDLGMDIIIAAGGAIQGHPMGPTAGARAMMQSVEAAVLKLDVSDYAAEREELQKALSYLL